MAIALIQTLEHKGTLGTTTVTTTTATGAGNLLVIATLMGSETNPILSVVDNKSNMWNATLDVASGNGYIQLWYVFNGIGGVTTITTTVLSSDIAHIRFYEFSGVLSTSDPLDAQVSQKNTTSEPWLCPTLTPSQANDLFIETAQPNSIAITGITSPFTNVPPENDATPNNAYYISNSSASQAPSWTGAAGSQQIGYIGVAFKEGSSTPAETPTTMFLSM